MNDWVHSIARTTGKTRTLIEASLVDKENTILICATHRQAERIRRDYGINTASLANAGVRLQGDRSIVLIDPDAVRVMVGNMQDKIDTLAEKARMWDAYEYAVKKAEAEKHLD